MYAREMQAYEMQAVNAYERATPLMQACGMQAYEMHPRGMQAYEMQAL
jgi:hypothetical protein